MFFRCQNQSSCLNSTRSHYAIQKIARCARHGGKTSTRVWSCTVMFRAPLSQLWIFQTLKRSCGPSWQLPVCQRRFLIRELIHAAAVLPLPPSQFSAFNWTLFHRGGGIDSSCVFFLLRVLFTASKNNFIFLMPLSFGGMVDDSSLCGGNNWFLCLLFFFFFFAAVIIAAQRRKQSCTRQEWKHAFQGLIIFTLIMRWPCCNKPLILLWTSV